MSALADAAADSGGLRPHELIDALFDRLELLPDRAVLRLLGQLRARVDRVEVCVLARSVGADGDVRRARRMAQVDGGVPRRDVERRVRRAAVVAGSAQVQDLVGSGRLSTEHVDQLAVADRRSGGEASQSPELVDALMGVGADGARKAATEWLQRQMTRGEVAQRHRVQRQGRDAWRHETAEGLAAITVAGDKPTIDRAWARLEAASDGAYRRGGGRDVPQHQRSDLPAHRRFDAALSLLCSDHVARRARGGKSVGRGKPAAVVVVAADGDSLPELVGSGPITNQTALEILERDAELWTLIADPIGQPLWLGRSRREPSRAQLIALICRDKGCVDSGASWQQCDMHHRVPSGSAAKGPTDIDNLVLVHPSTHQVSHRLGFTWELNTRTGRYERRPTRQDEQTPTGPQSRAP